MKQPLNIVFLDEYSLGGADLGAIKALGNYTGYQTTSPDEIHERVREADVIITNKVVLSRETLQALPRLKLICVSATGTNNIDMNAAEELGIPVKNAIGYSTHAVTETTIGAALALARNINYYDDFTKNRYCESGRQFNFDRPTHSLHGAHWGIIGLGNIGREVAKVASALGCEVCYTSTSGIVREEEYPHKNLCELLTWADVVSIHCPLTPHTLNLIDAPELSIMKRTAFIINVARGGIINEAALAEALDRDLIAGAALDVFTEEPLSKENPLLHVRNMEKLLLSPHNAWSPKESVETLVRCVADNIKNVLG